MPTSNDNDLAIAFSAQDYLDVALLDGDTVTQISINQYAAFEFKDKTITQQPIIVVMWKGKSDRAPSTSKVVLQIFDRDGNTWEDLAEDNVTVANTLVTLTGIITTNLEHYYDVNNQISCRVYQRAV